MSLICQHFESNAWRKDLCSHCFKSKDEHENPQTTSADPNRDAVDLKRYQSPASSMLFNRNYAGSSSLRGGTVLSTADLSPQATENSKVDHVTADPVTSASVNNTEGGILKKSKVAREKRAVKFHEDVVEITGFGGDEEFFSDEENTTQDDAVTSDSDDDTLTEEERHIQTVTQKNTSFNSVSRNLLESDLTKPAVRGFVSHGVTRPGETKVNSTPLVTIRPFGKETRPLAELKVNLVSPMRNGEVVAAGKLAGRQNYTDNQVESVKASEKITSFSTSVPESKELSLDPLLNPPSPPSSPVTVANVIITTLSDDPNLRPTPSPPLPSSVSECEPEERIKSRNRPSRPVLSRKPPVLKEKPRVPIKPQPAAATRPEKVENSTASEGTDGKSVSDAISQQPSVTLKGNADSPCVMATSELPNIVETTSVVANDPIESVPGLQSHSPSAEESVKSAPQEEVHQPSGSETPHREKEILNQEVDAVKRLDSLFSKDTVQTEVVREYRSTKSKPAPLPPSNATPRCATLTIPSQLPGTPTPVPETDSVDPSPAQPVEIPLRDASSTGESNSGRLISRTAFEALRANLAGSLELSRLHSPRLSTTKRQAPSPPTNPESPSPSSSPETNPVVTVDSPDTAPAPGAPETVPPAESFSLPEESSASPNSIIVPEKVKPEEAKKERRYRSSSASPAPRKTSFGVLVSFAPDAHEDNVDFSRSVSLSRLESDRSNVTPKPPSIRKMIKERAVQLFNNVNSNNNNNKTETTQGRMSRSDLFARNGKKARNRFSLRKLLGLKSDSKNEDKKTQPTEIIYAKSRPEIIHPLDLHSGHVEVVSVKPEELNIGIYACPKLNHSTQDLSLSSQGSSTTSPISTTSSTTQQANRNSAGRPRPPPPPRMNSHDKNGSSSNLETPLTRPSRPPPPKAGDPDLVQVVSQSENAAQYANLGNTRSSLTPRKPERTASLRSVNKPDFEKPNERQPIDDGLHYECVPIKTLPTSLGEEVLADKDGYVIPLRMRNASFSSTQAHRHSLSSFTSLKSINNKEHNDYSSPLMRSARPSLRQSRVDLHTSLEDHYGTVTGANLQALSQLLEQATRQKVTPPYLQSLTTKNLKWKNFDISTEAFMKRRHVSGCATVISAKWEGHDVLLLIREMTAESQDYKTSFTRVLLASFQDHVPHYVTRKDASRLTATVYVTIEVYPPGEMVTLPTLASRWTSLKDMDSDECLQKFLVVFLQILRAFVLLADEGKDTIPALENIVFYMGTEDTHHRLIHLEEDQRNDYENLQFGSTSTVSNETFTFLEASLKMVKLFQANCHEVLFEKLNALLTCNSTRELEEAKSFTEFSLFGPHPEILAKETGSRLDVLRKWLDIERAAFLNDVIQSHGLYSIQLSLIEELNLAFLVETSTETLLEASL